MQVNNKSLLYIASVILAVVLVIMPFHAAIVTIIGSHISFKQLLQAWKEILIGIIFILTLIAYIRDRKIFKFDNINIIAITIFALSIVITLAGNPGATAVIAGIKTNLVVLALFLSAQMLSSYFDSDRLIKLILYPAAAVVVIAILQPWVFTPDLLAQIGYNQNSILPGQFIESSQSTIRVFSTLGGPNQLGTYLIIPAVLCLTIAIKRRQPIWLAGYILSFIALYMTHSRSALIGIILATFIAVVVSLKKKSQLIIFAATLVLSLSTILVFSKVNFCTQFPQITTKIIHGDCNSGVLGGSDLQHINALKSGVDKISARPIGYGLGTAGPASFYTPNPLIVENWYLQIAIEVGILGLIAYIVFFALLIKKFYISSQVNDSNSQISLALLSIIVGVGVSAFFLHSLADSTLSIILFAILGIQSARVES